MFDLVKKAIQDNENVDLLMVKKLKFSKEVSPWFLSKIGNFEIISLLGKKDRESVCDVLLGKKNILPDKNVDLSMMKKSKIFKGDSLWFLPKIINFEMISLLGR